MEANIEGSRAYGQELIMDLHQCNTSRFTRTELERYLEELCNLIKMERASLHWWDYAGWPEDYAKAPDHLKGISCVQFIKTSNIVIHSLDVLKKIYINVFSCKGFDPDVVTEFTERFFGAVLVNVKNVERV